MVKQNAIFFDRDGVLIKAPVDENNKPKSIKTYDQIELTHNIKNIGEDILYTNFWINETYNSEDADTFFQEV